MSIGTALAPDDTLTLIRPIGPFGLQLPLPKGHFDFFNVSALEIKDKSEQDPLLLDFQDCFLFLPKPGRCHKKPWSVKPGGKLFWKFSDSAVSTLHCRVLSKTHLNP